jgi:GNAT superfamily N-acetyltransferase
MPIPEIRVTPVRTKRDWKTFSIFPWKVYVGDPNWVPPLIADVIKMFDPAKHPFHEHAEVECFLAWRGGASGGAGQPVGRIAAFVNRAHNDFHEDKTGFFGFFESLPDPAVPRALLQTAADWLKERGMNRMRGPANFSSNEEWGLLVDGFDRPPVVMMTYNPPAYARYLEDFGLVKTKDLVAYYTEDQTIPPRMQRAADRIQREKSFRVRALDMKHFPQEVERVRQVYNSSLEKNWGFVPMTEGEIAHMAKELKPVVDPQLVLFAEAGDRPVGFTLALPDVNQALKKANGRLFPFGLIRILIESKKIHTLRVLALGVVPDWRRRGVETLMILELYKNGIARGYGAGEFSWVLEDNRLIRRALEATGARVYKTYRLFDYDLTP